MNIQCEKLKKCVVEMDAILNEYWDRTDARFGVPNLDMDWDFYARAEDADRFVIITARDGDELVGFVMYHINPHPHHKTVTFAFCDILAVKLGHRHKKIGTRLVRAAESFLKLYYVKYVNHGFRTVYGDTEPLFPKLGYTLAEQNYLKVL